MLAVPSRPTIAALVAAAWCAAAAAGCRRGGEENFGVAARGAAADGGVDVAHLDRPGALEAALATPGAARRLGAHRRIQTVALDLTAGSRTDHFEEKWSFELDRDGHLHAFHDTSRDQGFEWVTSAGALFVRPRYGRFVRREPQGDEVERLVDEHAGVAASWLEVLGRFAARTTAGHSTVAGRDAVTVHLSLAPSPAPLPPAPAATPAGAAPTPGSPAAADAAEEAARAWRRTLRVTRLDGEVAIDARSGAPLAARLDASYTFERPAPSGGASETVAVTLAYRGAVDQVGAVASILPPENAVPAPRRVRPLLDRAALLDGLAAPPATTGQGAAAAHPHP